MRILLINTPRSGGTNLSSAICKSYKIDRITNPYKTNSYKTDLTILDEISNTTSILVRQDPSARNFDVLKNLVDSFEKKDIILLCRDNKKESTESYAYMEHYFSHGSFQQNTTKYIWEMTPNYMQSENVINESYNNLIEISKYLNKQIISYENLYFNNQKAMIDMMGFRDKSEEIIKVLSGYQRQRQYQEKINKVI